MPEFPIPSNDRRAQYTASAAQTVFPYDFPIFDDAELTVYRTRAGVTTALVLSTDYTVSGEGGETGGNVTLTAGATLDDVITIVGTTPNARSTDFQEGGDFRAEVINRELDRITIQIQELRNVVDRSLRLDLFDDPQSFSRLPAKADRASKYLGFDASGQPVATVGTSSNPLISAFGATLVDDANAAAARATLEIVTASESAAGLSEEATQAETDAGSAVAAFVPPDKLALWPQARGGWKNRAVRNGSFMDWSRGAGGAASMAVAASSVAYTANGWALTAAANQASVVSQQAGMLAGSLWCARVQRNSGQTGTGLMAFELPLKAEEIAALRSGVATLSLTLRAGANWSPASGNLSIALYTGTGAAPAKRTSGAYTGDATPISVVQAITSTATRYSFTSGAALGAAITQASIFLSWTPVGTAGAADYFEVEDVDVRAGPAAGLIERPTLEDCLRFGAPDFWKTFPYATAPAQNLGNTGALQFRRYIGASTATSSEWFAFLARMRVAPTMVLFSPGAASNQVRDLSVPADCSSSSAAAAEHGFIASFTTHGSSGPNSLYAVHATAEAGI